MLRRLHFQSMREGISATAGFAITLSFVAGLHQAKSASFDCKLAKTFAEKTICSDPTISQLDEELASAYTRASQSPQTFPNLRADQHRWLAERALCHSGECLNTAYNTRIAQLQAARCTAKVIANTTAIEDSAGVLKRGEAWGPVTQVKVDKKTGAMSYCAHGDYCYPATSIELSACAIDAKPDVTDDEAWVFSPS